MVNDSNIITINSTESKMKINKFSGNHKQATREGYSLVDISSLGSGTLQGVSYSVEDDVVTLNGAYTGSSAIPVGSLINSIPKKNATFRLQLVPVSGSASSSNIGIRFNKLNGSGQNEQLNYIQLAGTQNNFATKTMDLTELSTVNFFFASNTSATFNNYKFKLMLTEGAEEKEYEHYGVSPSIDYPSEIEAVGDNINIFDGETETGGYSANTGNKNPPDPATIRNVNFINVENLNTVMFSCDGESIAMNVFEYDTDKTFIKMTFNAVDNPFKLSENTAFINFSRSNNIETSKIKIEQGSKVTPYSPYGQGSVGVTKTNSNVMPIVNLGTDWEYTENGIKNLAGNAGKRIFIIDVKKGQTIKFGLKLFSKPSVTTSFTLYVDMQENTNLNFAGIHSYNLNQVYTRTYTATEDCQIRSVMWGNANNETFEFQLWANIDEIEDYVQYAEENYALPIQKPMLQGDYFIKEADGWKEVHGWGKRTFTGGFSMNYGTSIFNYPNNDIVNQATHNRDALCNMFKFDTRTYDMANMENGYFAMQPEYNAIFFKEESCTTAEEFNAKLAELNSEGNPLTVFYKTQTPTKLACTSEQITVLNELQNILLYDDTTHIVLGDVYPILDYDVSKIVDTTMTFEASLDENGYFVVPDYNIKCLVSYSESNIPTMPEAVESTVRVAGKDGDVVLGTTYEPISFTIVCYTDDNLSVEEKNAEELKMNNFLNSIKDKTIRLKIDSKDIFYNVKYNGLLTTINYPKHLRFSIPLKTSASFANNIEKSYMLGNATKQSNTAKKVGAIFTIAGPAQTPKIYLNDYEMFYNNVILSGAKLIIDSNRSTVTMVGRDGNLTNAMRYYNHEFPKIENGENVLKVSSGIDEDRQVSVEWFDLKL